MAIKSGRHSYGHVGQTEDAHTNKCIFPEVGGFALVSSIDKN